MQPAPKSAFKELQPELAPRPPSIVLTRDMLRFEDGDDLVRSWIDDEDLVADQDIVVASPLRIDNDHLLRERVQAHVGRNAGPDAYRNVQINPFHLLLFNDRADLGPLFGRQLRRSSRALTRGGAILLRGRLS